MTKVGIVGATGYAGVELVRLLLNHPEVCIAAIGSKSFLGQKLENIYPNMLQLIDLPLVSTEEVIDTSDVIFISLPHGFSQEIAETALAKGKKVIDLGADFRLDSEKEYTQWYDGTFLNQALQQSAVYGLPELFRQDIIGKNLVANPGCYPTSVALGIAPLLELTKVEPLSIIIDAKSGVTGAGKELSDTTHYPRTNENIAPYKIGSHRHTPEIEQSIEHISGVKHIISFTPHLIPVNRGILSTIYALPVEKIPIEALYKAYCNKYKNEPFVRVLPLGKFASLNQVVHSNYCNISLHVDERTGRIIIVSALDNMIKGASGQAIQNMNILCGWNETTGLTMVPPAF